MRAHNKFKDPYVHFENIETCMRAQDKLKDQDESSNSRQI
jgi:hypothetical protein